MEFKKILIIGLAFSASAAFAQRGKDLNVTVNTANKIVNEYTTLSADAAAGATTITVAASGLNPNARFAATLAAGDLIMIIQMQGATILGAPDAGVPTISNPNDATWGGVTAYNNCGNYEYAEVASVPSGTSITVRCGLTHSYTSAGRVQVIRVPRYNTLTITSPGVLTCPAWNGATGGVLAVEVLGTTTMNAGSKIVATGTGFRGGLLFTTTGRTSTTIYSCVSLDVGTNKGEGVAGYDTDYTPYGGKYCRGAGANAGGGGNVWNCGGGGGGNAGNLAAWTGQGNPDNSVAGYSTAWNLESAGFSASTSSGGGRGGYSFSNSNQNATLLGPGTPGFTNAWGGSFRYNQGGLGGRPLDYSTGRIFMGGGGGAGEQDNNQGGAGSSGGGIIFFTAYGNITGTGNDSIISNGNNGGSTNISGFNAGKDAGGGAGAGGTIILNTTGTVSGVMLQANGGIGGNQLQGLPGLSEAEGPGGGGSGGYTAVSSGAPVQQALGGFNGISQSPHVTEFKPNGATKGGDGLANQSITNFTITAPGVSICSGQTATLTATLGGTVPAGTTIYWYNASVGGAVLGSGTTFTTPTLASTTTYYVGTCPGTYTIPVVVTVSAGLTITVNSPTICNGSAATLTAVGGTTYSWNTGSTSNPLVISPVITTSYTVTGTTGTCSGTAVATVTVNNAPTTANAGTDQTVCGTSSAFAGNAVVTGTGTWTLISGAGSITTASSPTSAITALGLGANVFQWTITNAPCPASSDQVTITRVASPTVAAAGADQTVCGTTATFAGNSAVVGSGTWTLISGAGTITTPSSATSGVTALGVGPNVFQWTIANAPCPASSDQVTITGVASPTSAAAGPDQTVCGTSATLAGNTATVGNGIWTLISGAGAITTPSSPTSGITGLGVGANVFQWTISNPPCASTSDQVTITGVAAPTAAAAGPDQSVCGTSATFAGNVAAVGSGIWTLISGAGTITTPASPTSGVTALGTGPNVFQWTISNGACPSTSDQVTITGVASPTVANAGPDQTLCGSTTTLAGNTATVGNGTWTLVSGSGAITTPSSPTSGLTGLAVGANVFQWTITNAPCASTSDQVTINITSTPTVAAAGTDQTVCGTSATLGGNVAVTGSGTWTLISGAGTITSPASSTSTVTGLGAGANVFQWTITSAPCTPSSDQVTITSVPSPTTAAAGTDQTVCGTTATLAGNAAVTGTGVWTLISGAGTITTPSSPTSGITGLGAGPNVFQWTISNAPCASTSDQVTITGVTVPTVATAGTDQTVCGTIATLAGNTATTGNGTWSLISGAGTITAPSSETSGITGLGVGPNVFQWTITNAPCPSTSDQVTITGVAAPTVATAGSDQSICGTTATLAGNTAVSGTGTWSLVSGAGTITTPSSGTSGVTGLGLGANIFQWTIDNAPCPSSNDQVTITANPPTDATINNVAAVCNAASPFNMTAAQGGGAWTGTGITDGVNGTFDPAVSGIGTFTITYTISGPCGSVDTTLITVTNNIDATINNVAPVCIGSAPFNFTAANSGGTWTGTGITSGASGTFDPGAAGVGTFTITYTITGSCGNIDTAMITVTPNADPTITPVAAICQSASPIMLNAATAGGIWTGTGITDSLSGTFDPSVAGIGSHIITYTISGSCAAIDTVLINVNSTSDATISPVASMCVGASSFNLTAATAGGTWTGTGITSGSAGTFDPSVAGVGSHVITYTISGTCSAADTATINVTTLSDATITSVAPACVSSASFNLSAATAGGTWSGTGITSAASGTFDPGTAGVGTHIVTYTISGSCGNTDTASVTVIAPANASITAVTPVCAGTAPFNLTAATAGGTWSGTGITSASAGTFSPTVSGPGTFTVTYIIAGACGATGTQTVTVNALPTPTITSDINNGCAPVCVQFSETGSTSCVSQSFDFGDGGTGNTSSPTHCYALPGSYNVTISCTDANNCTGSTTVTSMINVAATPTANISVSPGSIVAPNTVVSFADNSTGGGIQSWNFGDVGSAGNTSSLPSDTHTYTAEGTYCITLVSSNISGCVDTATDCIVVVNDASFSVPNIFTPNGDGSNDAFFITSSGVKDLVCEIYDRWGLKIVEITTINGTWDGHTTTGNLASDGVYFYILKVDALNDKKYEQKGFIQLIRGK